MMVAGFVMVGWNEMSHFAIRKSAVLVLKPLWNVLLHLYMVEAKDAGVMVNEAIASVFANSVERLNRLKSVLPEAS